MPKGIAKSGKRKCHRRIPPVLIVCEVCGKVREYAPSQVRQRTVIRFCSRKCMGVWNDKRITLACDYCGEELKRQRTHVHSRNYCSNVCRTMGRRKTNAKWRDPIQVAAYMHRYVQTNRADHNRRSRNWWRKHPDLKAMQRRARRAKAKVGAFTVSEWQAMKKRYRYYCLRCHRIEPEIRLEPDHVVSISNGGIHAAENIQPLCRNCNAWKGANTIDFRQQLSLEGT